MKFDDLYNVVTEKTAVDAITDKSSWDDSKGPFKQKVEPAGSQAYKGPSKTVKKAAKSATLGGALKGIYKKIFKEYRDGKSNILEQFGSGPSKAQFAMRRDKSKSMQDFNKQSYKSPLTSATGKAPTATKRKIQGAPQGSVADATSTALGTLGMIPAVGNVADLADVGLQTARGKLASARGDKATAKKRYADAAVAGAAAIPGVGQGVRGAQFAAKAAKAARKGPGPKPTLTVSKPDGSIEKMPKLPPMAHTADAKRATARAKADLAKARQGEGYYKPDDTFVPYR